MQITDLLAFGVKNKASDLHLSAGLPPMIRVHGDIRRINLPEMSSEEVGQMITSVMNDQQRKLYQQNMETDFAFELPNVARFRVNAFTSNRAQHRTHLGRLKSPAHFSENRRPPARACAGYRPHRLGQIHHTGGDDQLYQRHPAFPHPHHRRPD